MPETTYAWAPITKTVKEDDGTLLVYGPAASSELDRDQQRLDEAWLDQAMPRWLAEGGGVREQHDAKRAVGVGVGLSKTDDGAHMLTARIVDPVAVKKIEHGVLRGFSVGIKNPRVQMGKAEAPNGLVVAGDVIEVSVVDRPANPGCLFELAKADGATGELSAVEDAQVVEKADEPDALPFGLAPEVYEQLPDTVRAALAAAAAPDTAKAEEPTAEVEQGDTEKADLSAAGRKKAAASGAAMPDGSYPITTKSDLRKAIKAVGRGGADHEAIRRHIIKRAKALGLEGMVPADWNADGSLKGDADTAKADTPDTADAPTVEAPEVDAAVEKAEAVLREVRGLVPALAKADAADGETPDSEMGNEGPDIDGAQQAIACIAGLIVAEAEMLAQGNLNESFDISLLLQAVESLKWFIRREQAEDQGDDTMCLADTPEVAKADTPTQPEAAPTPETPVAAPAPDFLTKADVTELVKSAVAEASNASEERIKALEADLAKAHGELATIKAQPVPGGPALTRTADQQAQARNTDAAVLRAQASEYLAKADACTDRGLREGYLAKAADLMAKADA